MNTIAANVSTPNGGKYVRQLCKHWSHKFEVEQNGDSGAITFPEARVTMAADGEGIAVRIAGENREAVERLTEVVAKHIDRFAFREDALSYDWAWE